MTFLNNGTMHSRYIRLNRLSASLILLVMIAAPQVASAIDINRNLPISIESDRAELDDSTGVSSYHGNVLISQGGTQLKADNITVIAIERALSKIVANGKPASFIQSENGDEQTSGQADQITYIAKDAILLFEGQAKLAQQTNSFAGERIEYDIMRKAIKAKGDQDSGKRVKIQYFPNAVSESDEPQSPPSSQASE